MTIVSTKNKRKNVEPKNKPVSKKRGQVTPKLNTVGNPFIIERGILHGGNRTNPRSVSLLKEAILQLPVDKNVSVLIPITEADSETSAGNLFLNVKRSLQRESDAWKKGFPFTKRAIYDAHGKYTGTRIWRLI